VKLAERLKLHVDRLLPRTGWACVLFFAAVVSQLILAPALPKSGELGLDARASRAAGGWCGLNFWRCRYAHSLVSAAGWLGLSVLAFVEVGLGRGPIGGNEQLVFLGVVVLALAFQWAWSLVHHTNALRSTPS
jgi:hypothetical protein